MSMMHVMPLNDEKPHEFSTACECSPRVDWVDPETGEPWANSDVAAMVLHNAFDCRELIEIAQGDVGEPGKEWKREIVE